jgi:peroxiredoxin Q/BCP
MLTEGDEFPDFELCDQEGRQVTKRDLLGKSSVVYFYPKDDTPGCTLESCQFRDALPRFAGLGAAVFGVSPDSVRSHKRFAEKHGLGFTLLADPERKLIDACGLWVEKSLYGRKYMGVERTTFLLADDGSIVRVWRKVTPEGHAEEVRAALESRGV